RRLSCGDRDFRCFLTSLFWTGVPGHRLRGLHFADGQDHGIRFHHRYRFLLSGLYGNGRFRRCGTSIDAKRRSFINAPHRRQCGARQDHPDVASGSGPMSSSVQAIRFESVSKSFDGRHVLDDVSFDVPPGTACCIMGRSGTGKSVTLKLLMGLLKPESGRIYVNDRELAALNSRELVAIRKTMGFLFQYSALFDSLSVAENVAFPLRRHTRMTDGEIQASVRERLAEVGLENELDKMPLELSGGMRKRVGLARALALKPSVLLVDEPSSGRRE